MDFIGQVFGSGDFRLHGYYYLWDAGLVWLEVITDSLIAVDYFSIPHADMVRAHRPEAGGIEVPGPT